MIPAKLSPSEYEAQKTQAERAEDIAYTINHSLACLSTDFITNPLVGGLTQKWLGKRLTLTGWKFKIFGKEFRFGTCGGDHDHSADHHHEHSKDHHEHHDEHKHGEPCDHDHSHDKKPKSWYKRVTNNVFGHTVMGEIVGDTIGVPVTIAIVRFAPGFTDFLRRMMEPVLGPIFRFGAKRASEAWARSNALSINDDATKEKARSIYEYEVRHLPQAALWTGSSLIINTLTQKLTGNKNPLWVIAVSCGMGVASTAAVVVGGRALVPQTAHNWDDFTSKKVFLPATKAVGKVFGVKPQDVERMNRKREEAKDTNWQKKADITADPSPAASR